MNTVVRTLSIGAVVAAFVAAPGESRAQLFEPWTLPNSSSRGIPEAEMLQRLKVYPQAAWYSPQAGGSGWYFSDVNPAPGVSLLNMTGFVYDTVGRQAFVVGTSAAPTVNNSVADIWSNRPLATWTTDLFGTTGGSCPTCAYVRPITSPSELVNARVEWTSPSVARLFINGTEVPSLAAADVVLNGGLLGRLEGRHYGAWQSRDQFGSGFPVRVSQCITEFARVAKPFSDAGLQFGAGAMLSEQPHPQATWLRASYACSSEALPSDGTFLTQSVEYIAVPPGATAPYALMYQLSPADVVNGSNGSVATYRISAERNVGRVYATGPDAHLFINRQAHDTRIVGNVRTLRRSRNP